MSKKMVDMLLSHMKKAHAVTVVTPWSMQASEEGEFHVRHAGLNTSTPEWLEIFPKPPKLLATFWVGKKQTKLELFSAQKKPFELLFTVTVQPAGSWHSIFGEFRRSLKKDKIEYQKGSTSIINKYVIIQGKR